MLSRTADSLFWLARYVERAENVARMVAVAHRMESVARSLGGGGNEWLSTLIATGCETAFFGKYSEAAPADVIDYLVHDPDNSSSIVSCLETARHNARAIRTALTTDMWEALNATWLGMRERRDLTRSGHVMEFVEWIRERSQLFAGAYASTMLRNDAYWFTRLGTFVERADCTARIVAVKYYVLLPQDEGVGGVLDYYQWQSILRSVSALRSYHWVYQERLQPWLVAEFLLLRPEMPRSLMSCFNEITQNLDLIAEAYGGKRGECHRLAGEMHAKLRYARIETIIQSGLHEFLTELIDRFVVLGSEISRLYLT